MQENAMYLGKSDIYQKIRDVGGTWNDPKDRPLVCLVESTEHAGLFWAIPVGNWNHRDEAAKKRMIEYMSLPKTDIQSCYYHVGNTTVKSIFFISDVIPITEKYIEREYFGFDKKIYIIKNSKLIQCLAEKLTRVLVYESSKKNFFRQHITDIKNELIKELELEQRIKKEEVEEIYQVQDKVASNRDSLLK